MRRTSALLLACLLVTACAGGEEGSTSFGNGPTAASATAAMTATMTPTTGADTTGAVDTTADPGTTAGPDATSSPDPDTGATVPADTGDQTTGFDTNPDGAANGLECSSGAECMSGKCYTITLPIDDLPPGICSDCEHDADCVAKGLGISCSVDSTSFAGVCTDGGLGSFCESQAACKPQYFCEELLAGAAALLPEACSECRDDADCEDGKRCTPRLDAATYTGNKFCAAPGSVPNDGMCPEFSGDSVCANGKCQVIEVLTLMAGVCGQCKTDADCGGLTCQSAKFSDGFVGSVCVP